MESWICEWCGKECGYTCERGMIHMGEISDVYDDWVSVKDQMPENGKRVLSIDNKGTYHIDILLSDHLWQSVNHFHMLMMDYELKEDEVPVVTHWKPLSPPKD